MHHSREDLQVAGNDYIACKYDEKWGIGLILEVDTVQLDAQDQHPPGPANTFFWPLKDDVCWVPFQNIFCNITTPITVSGRSYSITVRFQYNYECLC